MKLDGISESRNKRNHLSHDTKLLQSGLVGQMVQEKFEEENLAVFQNTQAAGFCAQGGCQPAIHDSGHAEPDLIHRQFPKH